MPTHSSQEGIDLAARLAAAAARNASRGMARGRDAAADWEGQSDEEVLMNLADPEPPSQSHSQPALDHDPPSPPLSSSQPAPSRPARSSSFIDLDADDPDLALALSMSLAETHTGGVRSIYADDDDVGKTPEKDKESRREDESGVIDLINSRSPPPSTASHSRGHSSLVSQSSSVWQFSYVNDKGIRVTRKEEAFVEIGMIICWRAT